MRVIRVPVAGLALGVVCALAASGRCTADIGIYEGQLLQGSGVSAKSWGSGTVKETEEAVYKGVRSLKVATQGAYQGVRLVLDKPADFAGELSDKDTYLEFVIKLPDSGGPAGGGMMGGPGGMMGGPGMGGRGMPGGSAGLLGGRGGSKSGQGGGPGGPGGGNYDGDAGTVRARPLGNLRAVLVTSDGKQIETQLAMNTAGPSRDGWRSLAIPLTAIKGLQATSGEVTEVRLYGDTTATFHLGRVRTIAEQTPLRVMPLDDRTAAINDTLTFTAEYESGVSPVRCEWTVIRPNDPTTDDLPVDSEGRTFKHRFRKGGDFEIVLTVRDPYGVKAPAVTRSKIHVTL